MKIAHLSKPWLPVPPKTYGGIERMVYMLAEGQANGAQITVFAPGGSNLSKIIKVSSLYSEGQGDKGLDRNTELAQAVHCTIECIKEKIDLIHAHSVEPFLGLIPFINIPSVFTFYNNPTPANRILTRVAENNTHFTFVSHNHRKQFSWIKKATVVYQGVDVSTFPYSEQKANYLTFVGSIADKKGILEAIEISRLANLPLKVAARIRPEDREFYQKIVSKVINNSRHVEFVGEVTDKQRDNLLKNALAMLFPIKWEEPFGGVMVESMAVGTPVIAFNRGSVPEVIKDGYTGFVVENIKQAVEAINLINKINPAVCRKWVEDKFSIKNSVEQFNELYRSVLVNKSSDNISTT